MSLFQKSVEKKYLNELDSGLVDKKFNDFQSYFGNTEIQENIRNLKEEEFQEGFIRELFVNILNYTLKPTPEYNIVLEKKNVDDTKKADGAILRNDHVRAVIELKSTSTADLDTVETQAFGYKNHHPECVYVITSNFEKLRFYIQNAVDYLEFDLFNLTKEQFSLLWLCLSKDNILNDLPLTIKESSVLQEEDVTKKLYTDYSKFREAIFENIAKNNPDKNELLLFNKTQKLLDRFLFIFFAEDRLLLPPNSISEIVKQWTTLKEELDAYIPLYDRFKKYFGYMNTGYKGKKYDVFPYNGGLFLPDEILDNITIDDNVLHEHTVKLSAYDFETDVDVNILGHIFEHSLAEIENVQAKLRGEQIDKQKTKRKKEGIYYTPKYITKYIVENTVGKLCEEKRNELEIIVEEYVKGRKNRKKDTIKVLDKKLTTYKNWLLSLTILDPACGSGAFLNQALEFLIEEHKKVDELRAQLFGGMVFSDITTEILERNIYGVDLNEESVEIAKLSLWLRTAQKGRRLNTLSSNIKCGNSLIDDPEVAGEKAFKWHKEFPEIFAQGGFDVVIGNPPYVNANEIKKNSTEKEYKYLKEQYETAKGTVDLYIYFFEKGLRIIKQKGILSYITPNRFLSASYGKALREFILNNFEIISLVDYSDKKVFADASTYPVISFFRNKTKDNYFVITGKFDDLSKTLISKEYPSDKLNILEDSILGFLLNDKLEISEKVINQSVSLEKVGRINATSTAKEADDYSKLINEKEGFKLINTGTIDPYITTWGIDKLTNKGVKYLKPFLPKAHGAISNNRQNLYSSPKLIISKIGLKCEAFYDKEGCFASINTNCIHSFNSNFLAEYVLCWLNSRLYNYIFECLFDGLRMSGGYLLFSSPNIKNTYIKAISNRQQNPFIIKSETMHSLHSSLLEIKNNYVLHVQSKFEIENPSQKIQNWYLLEFKEFLKELEKAKVKLSLSEEAEWMQYFNEQKEKAQNLKSEIEKTNKEINQMVYELYGLTEEEIKIVENS